MADQIDVVGRGIMGLSVGLRALPRPQVRSDPDARLLCAGRHLHEHRDAVGRGGARGADRAADAICTCCKAAPRRSAARGLRRNGAGARIEHRQARSASQIEVAPGTPLAMGVRDARSRPIPRSTSRANRRSSGDSVPRGFLSGLRSAARPRSKSIRSKAAGCNWRSGSRTAIIR